MKDLDYWETQGTKPLLLEKLVSDPTPSALQPYTSERTRCKCGRRSLPTRTPEKIKTLLAPTLAHEGPKIFNSLPKEVRGINDCIVNTFKAGLGSVADKPPVPGYTRCRTSNSISALVELMNRDAAVDHHDCEA